jgi:hypothetical protein
VTKLKEAMLPPTTTPAKDKYTIRNWKTYNKSLQQRGSVSIWIEQSLLREWKEIKWVSPFFV